MTASLDSLKTNIYLRGEPDKGNFRNMSYAPSLDFEKVSYKNPHRLNEIIHNRRIVENWR